MTDSVASEPKLKESVPKTAQETEKDKSALRDLLAMEIENKTRACAHAAYQCSGTRLEGFKFCLLHILQDPQAPYTNCAYTFPLSGHRCHLAAPRHDRTKNKHFSNFCFEHSRLSQRTKTRAVAGKMQRPDTVEGHLGDLTHYVRLQKTENEDEEVDVEGLSNDPLTEINASKVNERSRKILDYASDSEPEDDTTTEATLQTHDLNNSDCESIDSDFEDPLKHAGIFTTDEVCRVAREKLIRLRSLYLNQFHRLGYLLREKRRKYLVALRKERETYRSIHNQPRDTPGERHKYDQLKALNKYHRYSGVEAVLRRKYNDRRMKASAGTAATKPFYNKCTYAEGGVKCPERSIPCSKFCRRHILQDRRQVLFGACGVEKGGVACQEPLPMIFDEPTCPLHIEVPAQKSYVIRKYESDPEEDEDEEQEDAAEVTVKME